MLYLCDHCQFFNRNPGTQMLERVCGMTMHGDRPAANSIILSAPATLCKAYLAARSADMLSFFQSGFDRCADPCLEGRYAT